MMTDDRRNHHLAPLLCLLRQRRRWQMAKKDMNKGCKMISH